MIEKRRRSQQGTIDSINAEDNKAEKKRRDFDVVMCYVICSYARCNADSKTHGRNEHLTP